MPLADQQSLDRDMSQKKAVFPKGKIGTPMELPCHRMSRHHDNRKYDEVRKMIGSTYTGYKTINTSVKEIPFTLIESRTGALYIEETCNPIDVVEIMSSLQNKRKRGKIL